MSGPFGTFTPEPVFPSKKRLSTRAWVVTSASVFAAFVIGAIVAGLVVENNEASELVNRRDAAVDLFGEALKDCELEDGKRAVLSDRGLTLELDGLGQPRSQASARQTYCVLSRLDAPYRVSALMEDTRQLDGRQSDSWGVDGGEIEASWRYSPDEGLDSVLVLKLDEELEQSLDRELEDRRR